MLSLPSLFSRFRRQPVEDPLYDFASESETTESPDVKESASGVSHRWWLAAVLVILTAVAATGALGWPMLTRTVDEVPVRAASLSVTTTPPDATVLVDGTEHGVTPMTMRVLPGEHTVTVRSGEQERMLTLQAASGADIARDIEFAVSPPVADPVAVETPAHTTRRAESRESAPLAAGWVRLVSPFAVQIVEGNDVVGTSESSRIMLPGGPHDVQIVNRALEYQETRRLDVVAGEVVTLRVEQPVVAVNINALPWADVSMDGTSLGQTPIANAQLAVGTRTLTFRHPQFGERQQRVVVTMRPAQRIAIDLTK